MIERDDQLRITLHRCSSIELESWLWQATMLRDWLHDEATQAFYGFLIPQIASEISRRERVDDPLVPLRIASAKLDLERIKADFSVTDALTTLASVELRQRGGQWVGRCPFPDHDDSSPSLTVRGDGRLWRCWGCGRGGDLFTFCQHWYDTRSFIQAVELAVMGMGKRIDQYRQDRPMTRSVVRVA